MKIPLQDIIDKIKTEKGVTDEEIKSKILKKMEQLSGLISEEGAAHIIANELGVKIFEEYSGKLKINKILAGIRELETVGKVTQKYDIRTFEGSNGPGKVASLVIGDETGSIRMACWGDQADKTQEIKEGDIIKILGAYSRENQGRVEIHLNDRAKIIINPPGETIENVQERPQATRKPINELDEEDNIEIVGTIIQVYDPTFFDVCPKCFKRAQPEESGHSCPEHGSITPLHNCVMNLMLDDGTNTIRTVFFKTQMERLLGKTPEQLEAYKDNPQDFDAIKLDLIGNQLRLIGKVKKNTMFDRLEFTAQLVFTDVTQGTPNPEPVAQAETSQQEPKSTQESVTPEETVQEETVGPKVEKGNE